MGLHMDFVVFHNFPVKNTEVISDHLSRADTRKTLILKPGTEI